MHQRTISLIVLGGGVLALVSILPTVAATGDTSTADALIGALADRLIVLSVVIALLFEGALLYAVVRYRNSGDAQPPEYNPRLFVSYGLAIGVVLFFVGFASFQTLVALDQQGPTDPSEDAIEVTVTGQQFSWLIEYPEENASSVGTIVVPENETVHLTLTSGDVIHSFHAPELGLKQDVNPGHETQLTFMPTAAGEYHLFCAEFCGRGHSAMLGEIRVVDSAEYENWLEGQRDN